MPPRRNCKAAPKLHNPPPQAGPVQEQPPPPVQPAPPRIIQIRVDLRLRLAASRVEFPRGPKPLRKKKTAPAVKIPGGAPKRVPVPKPRKEGDDNLANKQGKRERQPTKRKREDSDEGYESDLPAEKKRRTDVKRQEEVEYGKVTKKPAKGRGRVKKAAQKQEESGDPVDQPEEPRPAKQPQPRKRKLTKKEKEEEEAKKGKWEVTKLEFGPCIPCQYMGELRLSREEWTFVPHDGVQIAEEPSLQEAEPKKAAQKPKAKKPKAKKPVRQVPGHGLTLSQRLNAWHDTTKKAPPLWLFKACEVKHVDLAIVLGMRKKGQTAKKGKEQAPNLGLDADDAEEEEEVVEEDDNQSDDLDDVQEEDLDDDQEEEDEEEE
ncbi:MAG: hypothetical protein Q9228_000236 [Teloschistes exilis]